MMKLWLYCLTSASEKLILESVLKAAVTLLSNHMFTVMLVCGSCISLGGCLKKKKNNVECTTSSLE
jgi:hypothetical protein